MDLASVIGKHRKAWASCLGLLAASNVAQAADVAGKPSTASPNVHIISPPMHMPQLGRDRTIRVYLPPGYAQGSQRYPVLYMHDGQNLFDEATGFAGEWGVDEALDGLAAEGLPLIVVGIDNGGEKRINELNAWSNARFGAAENTAYTDFIVNTLKPWVDQHYRTRSGRRDTGIMGSSMGGLASHYAIYRYPGVFSKAGIFSPAYWVAGPAVYDWTAQHRLRRGSRLYFVAGDKEGDDMTGPFQQMTAQLRMAKGPKPAMCVEVVAGAEHNEAFWRHEFPAAVRFLYGQR